MRTERIGHPLIVLEEVDSTNLYLAREFPNLPAGTVVVAEHQTAGRGRHGRRWIAPRKRNLMFSLLLPGDPVPAPIVTMMGALAAVEAINRRGEVRLGIRWPNDIVAISNEGSGEPPKIGGVLCETRSDPDGNRWSILGIGLNVNSRKGDLPQSDDRPAGSLLWLSGRLWDRDFLLASVLDEFGFLLERFEKQGQAAIIESVRKLCETLGHRVRVRTGKGERVADAIDLGPSGELVLEEPDGGTFLVQSGEVLQTRRITRPGNPIP